MASRPARARRLATALGLLLSKTAGATPAESNDDPASALELDQSELDQPEPEPALDEPEFDEPELDEPELDEPDPSSPDPFADDLGAIDDGPDEPPEPIRPPRVDGPYVGALAFGSASFASVIDLATPAPLFGGGGFVQAGDAVFPWMSIGIAAGGQAAFTRDQRLLAGSLLVEFGFLPVPRHPLSLRVGFGFGGGAIREAGIDRRFGFGGALFKGSVRYEFFPLAGKRRPDRGGGWAIGPELGWLGATPAGKGQPFVNTILLGVSTSFYFGS